MMRRTLFVLFTSVLLLPGIAAAQDAPRFALVMGYPAELGVLVRVTDRLAIRPELTWTHGTTETVTTSTIFVGTTVTSTSVTTTSTSNTIGSGVSGLIYVMKRDSLRTYLVPRFGYSRTSNSTDLPISPIAVAPSSTTTSSYGVSGALGAEGALAKHFGVFGEIGVGYQHSTLDFAGTAIPRGATNSTTGIRSGVGVMLFFGS